MRRPYKVIKSVFVFTVTTIWLLYGWPVVWFNPRLLPKVKIIYAANTGAKTPGAAVAVTSSAGDNNGFELAFGTNIPKDATTSNNAGIESVNSGTAVSSNCALPNTGSDQHDFYNFGISIPSGAKVTGITVSVEGRYDSTTGTNTVCSFLSYNGGTNWTTGKNTGDIQNTDSTKTLGTSTDLWGRSAWTATELNNTNFRLRLMTLVANVNRDFFLDYLTVTVYYNEAPNNPSLDLPVDGETKVAVAPTFKMTATDPDSDKLSYKVAIYSDSGCTNIVQTNDQAASSTGWTETNTTCTNPPTSCYTSTTQASYTVQSPLTNNTQYWWKASVKDPDGSGNFTDSTACNSFTTEGIVSVSITSDGQVEYGIIPIGGTKSTLSGELNDTQSVKNDGNVTEDFNIKSSNAIGGTNWLISSSPGVNAFVHEYSTNSGSNWTKIAAADSYQTLSSGIAVNGIQGFDLRITAPNSSTDYQQKTITVTIQVVQQ